MAMCGRFALVSGVPVIKEALDAQTAAGKNPFLRPAVPKKINEPFFGE